MPQELLPKRPHKYEKIMVITKIYWIALFYKYDCVIWYIGT